MKNLEEILQFTEGLIYKKTDSYLSELQHTILATSLKEGRKTYDDIAQESGYSAKYVKQDVAPKLWQLLSQVLDQKVTKSNVKAILGQQILQQQPIVESSASKQVRTSTKVKPCSPVLAVKNANILLIDNQPQNLQLLSNLLEEQGYKVHEVTKGSTALQMRYLSNLDLILLDVCLPELDGYTVCQKLKANQKTRDIPVIFMSSLNEPWNIVKAFSVGGSDYITKPFKVVEVLARVEHQLNFRCLQKELQELRNYNYQLEQELKELKKLS